MSFWGSAAFPLIYSRKQLLSLLRRPLVRDCPGQRHAGVANMYKSPKNSAWKDGRPWPSLIYKIVSCPSNRTSACSDRLEPATLSFSHLEHEFLRQMIQRHTSLICLTLDTWCGNRLVEILHNSGGGSSQILGWHNL